MSTGAVQAVILCEDRQLECFVRRFLLLRGWDRHLIRVVPVPRGRGSGEQWVRKLFPNELLVCRNRSSRAKTCLIVASDADTMSVEARVQTFGGVCAESNVPFRSGSEPVVFVIAKRNIETWLAYLRGENVNEEDTYRKYAYESECFPDVARLDQICREQNFPADPPPSLVSSCDEFKRIPN